MLLRQCAKTHDKQCYAYIRKMYIGFSHITILILANIETINHNVFQTNKFIQTKGKAQGTASQYNG